MQIQSIEFVYNNEEEEDAPSSGHLSCPACGHAWAFVEDDDGFMVDPDECACPHLRFTLVEEADDMTFHNGFTAGDLRRIAEPAARRLNPTLDGGSWEEFLADKQFQDELWEAVTSPELTHLFRHTQYGMACGPTSHTILFAACLPGQGAGRS